MVLQPIEHAGIVNEDVLYDELIKEDSFIVEEHLSDQDAHNVRAAAKVIREFVQALQDANFLE